MALNTAAPICRLCTKKPRPLWEAQGLYIGMDDYDGAGADLNYGRHCVVESANRIRKAVAEQTEGADVVMFTAGLGGGTVSAISELAAADVGLRSP